MSPEAPGDEFAKLIRRRHIPLRQQASPVDALCEQDASNIVAVGDGDKRAGVEICESSKSDEKAVDNL